MGNTDSRKPKNITTASTKLRSMLNALSFLNIGMTLAEVKFIDLQGS